MYKVIILSAVLFAGCADATCKDASEKTVFTGTNCTIESGTIVCHNNDGAMTAFGIRDSVTCTLKHR